MLSPQEHWSHHDCALPTEVRSIPLLDGIFLDGAVDGRHCGERHWQVLTSDHSPLTLTTHHSLRAVVSVQLMAVVSVRCSPLTNGSIPAVPMVNGIACCPNHGFGLGCSVSCQFNR